jgi:hypothetical protein
MSDKTKNFSIQIKHASIKEKLDLINNIEQELKEEESSSNYFLRDIYNFNRNINKNNKNENHNNNNKIINDKFKENSNSLNTSTIEKIFNDKEKVKILDDNKKFYEFSICENISLLTNEKQNEEINNNNINKENININLFRKNSSTTTFLENLKNPFIKNIDTIEIESFINENTIKNIKYHNSNNNNFIGNDNTNRSSSTFSKLDYDQISVETINTISIKDDDDDDY